MKEIKSNQVWKYGFDEVLYVVHNREKGKWNCERYINGKLNLSKIYLHDGDFEDKILLGYLRKDFIIEKKIIRRTNDSNN